MRIYDPKTMVTVSEIKKKLRSMAYSNKRFRAIDTSSGNSFGYSFDLVEQEKRGDDDFSWWNNTRVIASSAITNFPDAKNAIGGTGAYEATFNRDEVAEVLKWHKN